MTNKGKNWSWTEEQKINFKETLKKTIHHLKGKIGLDANAYKGELSGYDAKHSWNIRNWGIATKCEECGDTKCKKYDWANISGEYKRKRSGWKQLCRSCHTKFDKGNVCKNGHKLTPDNVYLYLGTQRHCRECNRIRMSKYRTNLLKGDNEIS